jgi:DNA primase
VYHFKLYKDAEKIFYNLDNIANRKDFRLLEGEFDVLAFRTAGVTNVVSVPNGFKRRIKLRLH